MRQAEHMDAHDIAIIILAAGSSTRFGAADKMVADYKGKPLAAHIGDTASRLGEAHIAITRDQSLVDILPSYQLIENPKADLGQGSSIALGAKAALDSGAKAALFLLADMPLITVDYLKHMIANATRSTVSTVGDHLQPPMLFFREDLKRLSQIAPDARGKSVLGEEYDVVDLPAAMARDVDTQADLKDLN